ncbi:MAG: hypothetical protein JSV58_01920 [Candidatus Bathyarchaeota archaeon]|nr:MAG: hypothetical protein JSV58_01920 [Candidatus Bathyarchaeota archaeon]
MSSHGFGKGIVLSPGDANETNARKIAQLISKIKTPVHHKKVIHRTHVWKEGDYWRILFEFRELKKFTSEGYTLDDLKIDIARQEHDGHRLHVSDWWLLPGDSYDDGDPIPDPT